MHFLGEEGPRLLYHRASASLHVDLHFGELVPIRAAVEAADAVSHRLSGLGIETLFPTRIARVDFTGDVLFASPAHFNYVYSAFAGMLVDRGRVVEPYRASTLYVNASRGRRTKRLGRVYDKGQERAEVAGWRFPASRYMRIEAERLWETARPEVRSLDSTGGRETFLDRFGCVGRGTLRLSTQIVDPLIELLRAGTISTVQYEQLYTFLDHARMGFAGEVYSTGTYGRRARLARECGLEVPSDGDGLSDEASVDARELVHQIAACF